MLWFNCRISDVVGLKDTLFTLLKHGKDRFERIVDLQQLKDLFGSAHTVVSWKGNKLQHFLIQNNGYSTSFFR